MENIDIELSNFIICINLYLFYQTICNTFRKSCSSLVIEALKEVDGDRKCFRLVGGVLVERTVKEVLPALQMNHEQVSVSFYIHWTSLFQFLA